MSEPKKLQAVKVTLNTGKVVILRNMKITDTEQAAMQCAQQAEGDQTVLQLLMQRVLLTMLLLQIDGKAPSQIEKEDLDSLFSVAEYGQVLQVIGKMSGAEESKKGKSPKLELVSAP